MQPRSPSESAPDAEETQQDRPRHNPAAATEGARWPTTAVVALAVSLALHAVLLTALARLATQVSVPSPPPAETVSVEVLSAGQFAALTHPEAEPTQSEADIVATLPTPAVRPTLRHATTILSDALGPGVRRDLVTLAFDTRFEQICDVEAMEQIAESRPDYRPERAVAYATAEVKVAGNIMIADGAAFLSGGRWYGLKFRCETSPDHLKVTSFDFATGEPLVGDHGLGSGGED